MFRDLLGYANKCGLKDVSAPVAVLAEVSGDEPWIELLWNRALQEPQIMEGSTRATPLEQAVGRYSWSDGARSEDKYERPPQSYVRPLLQQLSILSERLGTERSRLNGAEEDESGEGESAESSKLKRLQSRHIAAALKAMSVDNTSGATARAARELFMKEVKEIQRKGSSDNPLGAPLWEAFFSREELAKPPLLPLLWDLLECTLEQRKLFRGSTSGAASLLGAISQRHAASPHSSRPLAEHSPPYAARTQSAHAPSGHWQHDRRQAQYSG